MADPPAKVPTDQTPKLFSDLPVQLAPAKPGIPAKKRKRGSPSPWPISSLEKVSRFRKIRRWTWRNFIWAMTGISFFFGAVFWDVAVHVSAHEVRRATGIEQIVEERLHPAPKLPEKVEIKPWNTSVVDTVYMEPDLTP